MLIDKSVDRAPWERSTKSLKRRRRNQGILDLARPHGYDALKAHDLKWHYPLRRSYRPLGTQSLAAGGAT
jgi:hypothetical protein